MSKNKLSYWKNHPGSAILRLLVWLSAIITVAVMAFLVGFILIKGVGNLTPDLFALEYNSDNASLMPALINTLIITLLSLVIAVPFGIFAAIYLVEYAKKEVSWLRSSALQQRLFREFHPLSSVCSVFCFSVLLSIGDIPFWREL